LAVELKAGSNLPLKKAVGLAVPHCCYPNAGKVHQPNIPESEQN